MSNWIIIKKKILFSYMDCDWTSIRVRNSNSCQIKEQILNYLNPSPSTEIYTLKVANVKVCFYIASHQHFDFDPKQIIDENQWNEFLDFFKSLSIKLNSEILFRPEDSDYENENSVLINISGETVNYNFLSSQR